MDIRASGAMTLPAISFHQAEVAEAERFADQWVEQELAADLLGVGISTLHQDAPSIIPCQMIKCLFVGNIFFRPHVLQAALNGFLPARMALGELVLEFPDCQQSCGPGCKYPLYCMHKQELPDELKTFAKACANPHFKWPGQPGASRLTHAYSDIDAVRLLLVLSKRFPRIPTTSRSARVTCHCDIVAGAFTKHQDRIGRGKMSRGQVKQIWKRYKRYQIRGISDPQILNIFTMLSG
jgi:hypothetical protein